MATATELEVRPLPASDPTAAALLNAYAAEIESRFISRAASRVATDPAEYATPTGSFLVVYEDGEAIACGGLRALPDGAAEVKRMYVVPDARGRGVAARLPARPAEAAPRLGH